MKSIYFVTTGVIFSMSDVPFGPAARDKYREQNELPNLSDEVFSRTIENCQVSVLKIEVSDSAAEGLDLKTETVVLCSEELSSFRQIEFETIRRDYDDGIEQVKAKFAVNTVAVFEAWVKDRCPSKWTP